MPLSRFNARGLVLVGCGKMGSALLEGWLKRGFDPGSVHVTEPHPSDWLKARAGEGVNLNARPPGDPGVVVIAVKPQMMEGALSAGLAIADDTLVISIAAGTPIARFAARFGARARIVRAMPNTPAAVGKGITALIGSAATDKADMERAAALMAAVGQTVLLEDEGQMDAVTALSGSGPAYVFHMIECMTAAGIAAGLPAGMATQLARATVAGAGALAEAAQESAAQLRVNVTSPGGTTAAALGVLMDEENGLGPLMTRSIAAAAARSRELAG